MQNIKLLNCNTFQKVYIHLIKLTRLEGKMAKYLQNTPHCTKAQIWWLGGAHSSSPVLSLFGNQDICCLNCQRGSIGLIFLCFLFFFLWVFDACYEILHKHADQLSLKSRGIRPHWVSCFLSTDTCTCHGAWRNSWMCYSCTQVTIPSASPCLVSLSLSAPSQ